MTNETRLHEVQHAALRTMAVALATMKPLALQILDADAQMRAILQIIDTDSKETR